MPTAGQSGAGRAARLAGGRDARERSIPADAHCPAHLRDHRRASRGGARIVRAGQDPGDVFGGGGRIARRDAADHAAPREPRGPPPHPEARRPAAQSGAPARNVTAGGPAGAGPWRASGMMDHESRIIALVEEILDSDITPEEACRETPELLAEVRNRLEQFRSIDKRLLEVFPPHTSSDESVLRRAPRALPVIPGYEVQGTVGTGGMGVVYRARHIRLDRLVAIKMLL